MSLLADIVRGALLGLTSALQPGPFQAVVVARSLRTGPVRALPLAFVPVTTDPLVIATVLTALTQLPGAFLRVLTAGGILLLLWIAFLTLRQAARAKEMTGTEPRGFLEAALVNVVNPGAWLFWSLVGGPILAAAWRVGVPHAVAFLASFYTSISGGNAAIIGLAGGIAKAGPRAARALWYASGVALIGFAAWQGWRLAQG